MKHLAVIPARSGSKGLPDKNIKPLAGKPLMAWTIEAALKSDVFDTVHVSTDSEKYAEIARKCRADVPFLRSAASSSDTASSWSVLLEVLEKYAQLGQHFDTVTLLQPTSPLRISEDIRGAYHTMEEKDAEAVISVCETDHSPLWCNTLPENGCMDNFLTPEAYLPRQSLHPYYRLNGAIYMILTSTLLHKKGLVYDTGCYAYIMPRERSIDIDDSLDFMIVEKLIQLQQPAQSVQGRSEK